MSIHGTVSLLSLAARCAAGPEPATGAKPARGPEYGNVAARDAWPTVTGDPSSLHEMFQNRHASFRCTSEPVLQNVLPLHHWVTWAEVAPGSGC